VLGSGTITYTIHKLDKPKVRTEVLGVQLIAIAEVIKHELAQALDPEQVEPGIKRALSENGTQSAGSAGSGRLLPDPVGAAQPTWRK